MISPWVLVIVLIIAAVILMITSILTIFAAGSVYSSPSYGSSTILHSAHVYLTVAAVMASMITVIIIIVIAGFIWLCVKHKVNPLEVLTLLAKKEKTKEDVEKLFTDSKNIHHFQRSFTYMLICLGLLLVIDFIVGILSFMAWLKLGSGPKDNNTKSAYTLTIIATLMAIPTLIIFILVIVGGSFISSSDRKLEHETTDAIVKPKDETKKTVT